MTFDRDCFDHQTFECAHQGVNRAYRTKRQRRAYSGRNRRIGV